MFRLFRDNLRTNVQRKFYLNITRPQVNKTENSSVNKIKEPLSFLKSEEEMRKYFNIVDWDKKNSEKTIQKRFDHEKEEYTMKMKNFKDFNREELYKIATQFNNELKLKQISSLTNFNKLEIQNEFSMENVEFLKDKPHNYILVSGFENLDDIKTLLNLIRQQGEVVQHNIIYDLMGKASCLEVYFYQDEIANKTKTNLHNFNLRQGIFLRVWNHLDALHETLDDKTIVISELDPQFKQRQILEFASQFGNVVKLQMPLSDKANTKIDIFNLSDKFFKEIEMNLQNSDYHSKLQIKNRLQFYSVQINKLMKEFKDKISHSDINSPNYFANINNLLVEIKFFMKQFFPNETINELILPVLNSIRPENNNVNLIENINQEYQIKSQKAFDKILNNLENFLKKYEEKIDELKRPLTSEEIPLDMIEIDNNNKTNSTSQNPEKLDRSLIYESVDQNSQNEIKNELMKINYYSTFLPLQEQVAKLNFLRSLSHEEKQILKDKFDLNLSVNTPKFLDYFINFSQAIGIKVIDKYMELSELYMSMTPLEKMYHGKKLAKRTKTVKRVNQDEELVRENLMDFLGIRRQKKIKDVYHLNALKNMLDEEPHTRFLDIEADVILTDLYNMIQKGNLPNITVSEFLLILKKNNLINQKIGYIQALVPMNLAKKRLYIERTRARMVKYNEILLEFVKNYDILPEDSELRLKYDSDVKKLSQLVFGKVDPLTDVNMELLEEENEGEKKGFNLPDKNRLDVHEEGQLDKRDSKKSQLKIDKSIKFNKSEFKYSGLPLTENQITNRLDYIRSQRDKVINTILRISNLGHYNSKKYEKLNQKVQNKLLNYVNSMFKDNPKLHSHYLEKINNKLNSFKYVNIDFDEKQYRLEELVEDIVQKEIDYKRRVEIAKRFVNNLEDLVDEKISKGNLVKALSVYESMMQIHEKYNDYRYMKSIDRAYLGSPVFVFFNHVKEIFQKELEKVEKVKLLKLEEFNRNENLSMDELFNTRKELIEDYTNKIVSLKQAQELNEDILNELQNYKLKRINFNKNTFDILDDDDSLQNEIMKKEYEITQNRIRHGVENEEEYKDVSSLISNLNKIRNNKNEEKVGSTYEKLIDNLNGKRPLNKGYAFVTFATSDMAKKFYLISQAGMKISKKKVKVQPKFDLTHQNFDEEFMLKRAKADGNLINKRNELISAENKLKEYEEKFYENLSKRKNLNEIKSVREAFKDSLADPFKKHDKNNPFTVEEEEEIKYRAKMSLEEDESAWLFEDDNLERMRISRDKRIVNKYTEAQLLKKGILSEDLIQMSNLERSNKIDSKYEVVRPLKDSFFNESNDFDLIKKSNNNNNSNGRRFKPLSQDELIESVLHRDYLHDIIPAFHKDNRESVVYSEIQELRERFPKDKFLNDSNTNNLINEVNQKFVRLLKYEDQEKKNENVKEELLESLTNLTPLGKQLQMIINERNEKVQDEETRQMITMQNFFEKRLEKHFVQNKSIRDIPEKSIDNFAYSQIMFQNSPYQDLFRVKSYDPPLKMEGARELKEEEIKKFEPGDTSFEAFLHRRRDFLDTPSAGETKPTDEADKTQFDSNNLNIDNVKDVFTSIKEKYEKHLGVIDQIKNRKTQRESLYDFVNNQKNNNKSNSFKNKTENILQQEKLKKQFLEELENNFSEELETLPNFKEYFLNLKYGRDSNIKNNNINENNSIHNNPIFNFSKTLQFDTKREQYAILNSSDKITAEIFEKSFINVENTHKKRLENWISENDKEYFTKLSLSKMGVNPEDKEAVELVKAENPHLFDEEKAKEYLETQSRLQDELEEIENFEDKNEVEYFFNSESGETLEEHLAGLSRTNFDKVTLRKDDDGRIIIRREFKNNYKYDLDELMNFDIVKEREKMMKKLENFDFKSELNGNVDYMLKFSQLVNSNENVINNLLNSSNQEFSLKITNLIQKTEDYFRVNFSMENFYFDDFKRLVDNLLTINPKTLTNFVQSISKLIRLTHLNQETNTNEISQEIKSISQFSKDIFNEREVRIFTELMIRVLTGLGDKNIRELDNLSKFIFIQNVLLKDVLNDLSNFLSNEENVYLYGMLKLLPNKIQFSYNYNDEQEMKKRLKVLLWKDYKNNMLNNFNIVLKKENEIKPEIAFNTIIEYKRILSQIKEIKVEDEFKNVEREIEEYSEKLKEYYVELSKANTSDFDLSQIVDDEETFIDEITEQIETRLRRLKYYKKISKDDLVRRRYNEDNLYKKQLEYVYKVGKKYEAMAFRDDVEKNEEMLNEVTEALRKNALRKKNLLKEGRPEIDFDYPRLI